MRPIQVVFSLHIEPFFGPPAARLQQYLATREETNWLRDIANRYGAKLSLQSNGEYMEMCRARGEQEDILACLREGHVVGTHAHAVFRGPQGQWVQTPPMAPMEVVRKSWADAAGAVEAVVGHERNTTMCAQLGGPAQKAQLMKEFGFSIEGGGRNEIFYNFFGHDVWNPYRPGVGAPLEEDLTNKQFVIVPHVPQIGERGPHGPPGAQVFFDLTIPHMKSQFLQAYLEWLAQERAGGSPNVWVFGWCSHPNMNRRFRADVEEFLKWLNENFIGHASPHGNTIAQWATFDDVAAAYADFEAQHPGESSFSYSPGQPYPYLMKTVMEKMREADFVACHSDWEGQQVHCYELTAHQRPLYVLWKDSGTGAVDFSSRLPGQVKATDTEGKTTQGPSQSLVVGEEPLFVATAETDPAPSPSAYSQITLNINYIPDRRIAEQNCANIKRHVELMRQYHLKGNYYFTWLAAKQIADVDPAVFSTIQNAGFGIYHHGANRPPRPTPLERCKGMSWEEDVAAIREYESQDINPTSGQLIEGQVGGLLGMRERLGWQPFATGRFFKAPILAVCKEYGVKVAVGLRDNTGAPEEAAWYMGVFNRPDTPKLTLAPARILAWALQGAPDPRPELAQRLRQLATGRIYLLSVLMHDTDFLLGETPRGPRLLSTPQQDAVWSAYEEIVKWVATNPALKNLSLEDIYRKASDDRERTLSRDQVMKVAQAIAVRNRLEPPMYMPLEGSGFLSLADVFHAFAVSLGQASETGLPGAVRTRDILGPTEFFPGNLPPATAAVQLPEFTGQDVVNAARDVLPQLAGQVPARESGGIGDEPCGVPFRDGQGAY